VTACLRDDVQADSVIARAKGRGRLPAGRCPGGFCHCEGDSPKQSPTLSAITDRVGDCFVAKNAPRNDRRERQTGWRLLRRERRSSQRQTGWGLLRREGRSSQRQTGWGLLCRKGRSSQRQTGNDRQDGDCFVTKDAPRNDRRDGDCFVAKDAPRNDGDLLIPSTIRIL
jgi:hypothetical protein